MRFPRIYEEDGCCTAAECDLCGGEIYRGRRYYRINGQTVCPDCLADYARAVFAGFACGRGGGGMVRRDDVPWAEVQKLNAQGWSYRQLAEKFGVSSSAIGRRAVQECWHGTDAQRANARLRNLAAGLRRQAGAAAGR